MSENIRKKSHGDLPATVRLVKEIRSELRAEIRAVDRKLDSKFELLRSDIQLLHSDMLLLRADVHRSNVLAEEQRSENRIVLDALKNVIDQQIETRQIVDSMRR